VSLIQSDVVRVFDKWALGIHHGPGDSVLVTGMSGEVVELDPELRERRRWQAHEGSVNALRVVDGQVWTAGGDGAIRQWDGATLEPLKTFRGPRKPVTSFFFSGCDLVAQSYERAVYLWPSDAPDTEPRKIAKVATLALTRHGPLGCPKTGSKAGDIGPLAPLDLASGRFGGPIFDDGFAAWSVQDVAGRGVVAFGLDLQAVTLDLDAGTRTPLGWHSKSGPPSFVALSGGGDIMFGDGQIYHQGNRQAAPVKGLYCAIQLLDGRVAFAGADGQIWVFEAA
jgi:hypothetical protein